MIYYWYIRSHSSTTRDGYVNADTDRQAKVRATKDAGVEHWKKAWRSEMDYWVKYGAGDGRLSNLHDYDKRSHVQLVLRKLKPGEEVKEGYEVS